MSSRPYDVVIYGAYGYTGRLTTLVCKSKNLKIFLSGRSGEKLASLANETGCDFGAVDIQNESELVELLKQAIVVIHCAGPFSATAKQMAAACIKTSTHYLDITGEHEVFEYLHTLDDQAKASGIMIMPGTGFDVVPTDCLAAHLKKKLPDATHLQLAFASVPTSISRGTAKTAFESFGKSSLIRANGVLQTIGSIPRTTTIDFGERKLMAVCISWGDIVTAWHTTGIPNIEVYMSASPGLLRSMKMALRFKWFLRLGPVRNFLAKKLNDRPAGPNEEILRNGKSLIYGKVWNRAGVQIESRLVTSNGYRLTADMAALIAEKVVQGNFQAGFMTPAGCFGADLILELPQSKRKDA